MRSITIFVATVLLSGTHMGMPQVSLAQSETPPIQNAPSIGAGAQEPAPPEETGAIQERGILPGRVAPGLVMPGTPLQFNAPTSSLAAIRNAIKVTAKSISVNLRIPPNLPVTVPVEVSVAYISPAKTQRLTKPYSPTSGLTLLYREAEGDGKPRPMHLDITVRELVPNGQSFSISRDFTITPLYRASISPLRFNMATKCDTVGKSDITFVWWWPDGQRHEQKFDVGFGETKMVNYFSWGRKEFSTEANLREPSVQFDERDPTLPGSEYHPPRDFADIPLVPGPTKEFSFFLDEGATGPPPTQHSGSTKCKAHISYRIDRSVMKFDQF